MKTVYGFSIPLRELTEEEKTRDITIERIRDFHYDAGEDYLDCCDTCDPQAFGLWLLNKYPDHQDDIKEILKDRFLEVNTFNSELDMYGFDNDEDIDTIYFDYCEYVNTTTALKERDNQILIQVAEYYGD